MRYDSCEKLAPWCALNRIFGFSPRIGMALSRHFGSPEELFKRDRQEILELLGDDKKYAWQITAGAVEEAFCELERLASDGVKFVCIDDERYPALLRECDDPPAGLYVKSTSPLENIFGPATAIAVVGTRDVTAYGKEWCTRIVSAIASSGSKPVIISGLALGTDITAHSTALDRGIPTIAVMATGIDTIYPFRHGWEADKIVNAENSGLITDYPPGTVPKAINFLRRNRIIAGLSQSVILIESKIKGGGMMTCRLAESYNRDIYALPGRIDDICSCGCNDLIKRHVAEPITSIPDLLEDLGLGPGDGPAQEESIKAFIYKRYKVKEGTKRAAELAEVADIVVNNREIHIEDISSLTGIDCRTISVYAGILESDGIIISDLLRRYVINPKFM